MIDELEFGGDPPEDPSIELAEESVQPAPDPSNVIPFPRMRPSTKARQLWETELARANERAGKSYKMPSPLDAVPSLMAKRAMPSMRWPESWPEFARRCKTYVGECIGITGAIGGGKTSFGLQVCIANSGHGHPIIWQPLELDPEQLDLRLCANMHGAHMYEVRERWPEERISHALTAVDDLWHFVPFHEDPEEGFTALRMAIEVAWRVYRMPPVWAVDHLGELAANERDDRAALRRWAHRYMRLALDTNSYGLLLNQVSKGNQAATTGKIDFDSATDAMAIEMGSQAIASAVVNSVVLVTFKRDDADRDNDALDAHALVPKARNTGKTGRIGMRFRNAGGQWSELDYLPATPSQQRKELEADKKDRGRTAPRSPSQIRADLNAVAAGDAAAMMRARILAAITRHGAIGIAHIDLRKVPGVGRGAVFSQQLSELVTAGAIERTSNNRWRTVTRIQ